MCWLGLCENSSVQKLLTFLTFSMFLLDFLSDMMTVNRLFGLCHLNAKIGLVGWPAGTWNRACWYEFLSFLTWCSDISLKVYIFVLQILANQETFLKNICIKFRDCGLFLQKFLCVLNYCKPPACLKSCHAKLSLFTIISKSCQYFVILVLR